MVLVASIWKWTFKARCAYCLDHFDTLPYGVVGKHLEVGIQGTLCVLP